MGVPAFFRWLCSRNPKALLEVIENSEDSEFSKNPDIDNLYLDMNGIVHPCAHPEQNGVPIPVTYEDMFINVFNYIDRLVDITRPKNLIYMAIDGVAPRAKLNQQRSRRFRAAQESLRVHNEKMRLRDFWKAQGLNSDVLNSYIDKHFDSNQITPGTEFMQKLSIAVQYFIYERMNNNPLYKNLLIIFSDAAIPGEGEHKILQFIRDQRKQIGYKTIRHCLYGADADLIMLGLSTHEPYFYIIRETIMANDDKMCSICQKKGHFFMDCPKRDKQIEDINAEIQQYQQEQPKIKQIQVDFQILQLSIVREYLNYEMRELQTQIKFQYDIERIIDDFVFMCFLVGNDFLPHIPCLKITEGGIDCLLIIYKHILIQIGDYLTNCGELNLKAFNMYIVHVGMVEDELIKGQEKKKEIAKNRREQNKELYFKEQKVLNVPEISIIDNPNDILTKFKSALKERLTEINQSEMDQAQLVKSSSELKKWRTLSFKQRYYMEKFSIKPTQFVEFQHKIKLSYIEALAWTLKYYYNGCVDWGWFYPYHYAPFAQDLIGLDQVIYEFNLNKPFRPYQQLLAVLPPQSSQFLPRSYQQLMLDTQSPIADFYPSDFVVDLKGKKFAWLGEVVLPFIDADRLTEVSNINTNLSKTEQDRDRLGQTIIFSNIKYDQLNFNVSHINIQVEWLPRFPIGTDIKSPIPTMPGIQNNQIISGAVTNTLVEADPQFIQNKILCGTIMPPEFLDDYYMGQCDVKKSFGGEAVKRIITSILGINLFLGNNATNLGLTTQYLDFKNVFQEDDEIIHQFDKFNRPRSLYLGNDLDVSRLINKVNMKKLKQDEKLQQEEFEKEEQPHIQLLSNYLQELTIEQNQIFNYNKNFQNDNEFFICEIDSQQIENFSDYIQRELEKMNFCDGFEIIVDCESRYGQIGLNIMDLINDLQGSKTQKLLIPLFNKNEGKTNHLINKVLTLTQYQEKANIIIPIYQKELQQFKNLNLNQQLAFLINNFTSSYKCLTEYVSMHEFCQRIAPMPKNNIFNLCSKIPTLLDQKEQSILNYKQQLMNNNLTSDIQEEIINFNSGMESFGESYFLKGISPIPDDRNLRSYGIDIRITDYVFQVPQLFNNEVQMPLHTCIFSNECYKYTLFNLSNEFNKLNKQAFLQYEKQSLDNILELKHSLSQMVEDYGGIDDDQQ